MTLYNVMVRVVEEIEADSPEAAYRKLAQSIPDHASVVLPMEDGDVFVSENDKELTNAALANPVGGVLGGTAR